MYEPYYIDGVDVSKCEFCNNDGLYPYCYRINSLCKENPNCYYKQLQRKTTECEKNEKALEEIQKIIKTRIEEKYYENCRYFKGCNNPCAIGIYEELTTILGIIKSVKDSNKCQN